MTALQGAELETFVTRLFAEYGLDYRGYSTASLGRRLARRLQLEGLSSLRLLFDRLKEDRALLVRLVDDLSVVVTSMFRDPEFFLALRKSVVPILGTYPYFRIWHAGCASGEEVYSLAIILEECGLLARARIYATDINESALATAKARIVPIEKMRDYTRQYQLAGGERAFSDYYSARYNEARLAERLAERIVFASHNLSTDGVFCECQLIVCRNVLIYFSPEAQQSVLSLFDDSLCALGFLALGSKETLRFSQLAQRYQPVTAPEKIYRKMQPGAVP